jgi:hypothetical protein
MVNFIYVMFAYRRQCVHYSYLCRLLYDMVSPRANSGRGMTLGRIFRRDGTLVATTAQEGIIRLSLREQEKRRQRSKAEKESKI